jgi:hypothetical protein
MKSTPRVMRTLLLLAGLVALSGCHAPLAVSIGCEQILGLRVGQTGDEVRALLGEPRLVQESNAVPWFGREPLLRGVDWSYGPSPSLVRPVLIRDELNVAFYQGRLTWVSAYRKRTYQEGTVDAFWLMKDPRKPEVPEERRKGEAFDDLFPCRSH